MIRLFAPALVMFILATSAEAQVQPVPGDGDPHLQIVDFSEGKIVQLRGAPGYQLMVELSSDERVQSVALGDSGSWQVGVSKAGDRLFLKPIRSNATTNMTVVTSGRIYTFDLLALSGPSFDMPYTIQFRYPASKLAANEAEYVDVSRATQRLSRYKISGDPLLRPTSVTADGQHTYISWPRGASIPVVYVPDEFGNEVLFNGMMGTDDVYVVDGAPQKLIFRIDRSVARAERIRARKVR